MAQKRRAARGRRMESLARRIMIGSSSCRRGRRRGPPGSGLAARRGTTTTGQAARWMTADETLPTITRLSGPCAREPQTSRPRSSVSRRSGVDRVPVEQPGLHLDAVLELRGEQRERGRDRRVVADRPAPAGRLDGDQAQRGARGAREREAGVDRRLGLGRAVEGDADDRRVERAALAEAARRDSEGAGRARRGRQGGVAEQRARRPRRDGASRTRSAPRRGRRPGRRGRRPRTRRTRARPRTAGRRGTRRPSRGSPGSSRGRRPAVRARWPRVDRVCGSTRADEDVGATQVGEQRAEREPVGCGRSGVVGDDDLRSHGGSSVSSPDTEPKVEPGAAIRAAVQAACGFAAARAVG